MAVSLKKSAKRKFKIKIQIILNGEAIDWENVTQNQFKLLNTACSRARYLLRPKYYPVKTMRRQQSFDRQLKIVALRRAGHTYQSIAEIVDCTKQYVGYVCKQYRDTNIDENQEKKL